MEKMAIMSMPMSFPAWFQQKKKTTTKQRTKKIELQAGSRRLRRGQRRLYSPYLSLCLSLPAFPGPTEGFSH